MSKIVKGDDFRWKNLGTATLLRVKLKKKSTNMVCIILEWASAEELIRCIKLSKSANRRAGGHRYIRTLVSFVKILPYALVVSPNVIQMTFSFLQDKI